MDTRQPDSAQDLALRVLDEARAVFTALAAPVAERLCDEIETADAIFCYGVGREGLMMRALCMRLMHLGFDAHVVGDMTTPPIGRGGLLLVSAGPGSFSTVLALMETASKAGGRTGVITAEPQGKASMRADAVFHLPAQTMASDTDQPTSVLPMGSLYEIAQLVFFDCIAVLLQRRAGQSLESMRGRHTNLE